MNNSVFVNKNARIHSCIVLVPFKYFSSLHKSLKTYFHTSHSHEFSDEFFRTQSIQKTSRGEENGGQRYSDWFPLQTQRQTPIQYSFSN